MPTILHHFLKLVQMQGKVLFFFFFPLAAFWKAPKLRVISPKFSYQKLAYLASASHLINGEEKALMGSN